MDLSELNAITLLYLSQTWDGQGTLLECAHKFQQTKDELSKALKEESGQKFIGNLESGNIL